eukprot:scaffold143469_cov301-Phaeocystis_antarctica.AAC.1
MARRLSRFRSRHTSSTAASGLSAAAACTAATRRDSAACRSRTMSHAAAVSLGVWKQAAVAAER